MDDEAEPSGAAQRHGEPLEDDEELHRLQEKEKLARERRLDAKRKRIRMLNDVLRDIDLAVYMELITVYYLDCSFFWLAVRASMHVSMLTPMPDALGERLPDEPKPFLPLVLVSFLVTFVLHQTYPAPSAGEDTRGYLHGGLVIDFIGQQGPTSRWRLAALDVCILLLQLLMVAVHVKRRDLKTALAKTAGSPHAAASEAADDTARPIAGTHPAQDADDEERGLLHRTDTLSEVGADADADDEDVLLSSLDTSDAGHADALDMLTSGQCVIGDFSLIDTILQENTKYTAYCVTRSESGMSNMPDTMQRLNSLRARFGAGGG